MIEQRFRTGLKISHAISGGDELEMFPDGQCIKELRIVGYIREKLLGRDRLGGYFVAADKEVALCGWNDAGDGAHRRGFAGAVGTEKAQDLARLDVKAEGADGYGFAIGLVKVYDLNHIVLRSDRPIILSSGWVVAGGLRILLSASQSAMRCGHDLMLASFERYPMLKA